MNEGDDSRLPEGTLAWVLGSGKIGHEIHCLGLARALGLEPLMRQVRPRAPFAALAPWGPIDPRDAPHRDKSPLAPPFPDIALAAGRWTIPYLRRLKKASGGRVFTICLQDPRIGTRAADMIWVPEHDTLRGDNVCVTLTSPHGLRPHLMATARINPDPRIAALQSPRVALVLGGPSAHHRYEAGDVEAIVRIATDLVRGGASVMATPSRRTPPQLMQALRKALGKLPSRAQRAFVWDGSGDNPYLQILANADAVVVTADSANMMGEAMATTGPVLVYEPSGGHPKMTAFLERLIAGGHVRRWRGGLESWRRQPIDATADIAAEAAHRYRIFRGG